MSLLPVLLEAGDPENIGSSGINSQVCRPDGKVAPNYMKAFNKEHYTNRNPQSVHVRDVRVMILTSGSEQILGGSNKNQLLYHENMYRPVGRGSAAFCPINGRCFPCQCPGDENGEMVDLVPDQESPASDASVGASCLPTGSALALVSFSVR